MKPLFVLCLLFITTISGGNPSVDSSAIAEREYKKIELGIEKKTEQQRQSLNKHLEEAKTIREDYDSLKRVMRSIRKFKYEHDTIFTSTEEREVWTKRKRFSNGEWVYDINHGTKITKL